MIKSLVDMGLIAMSQGGKTIDIKQSYAIAKMQAEIYFYEAAIYYEKTGNSEKAEELKKELEILFIESQIDK